MMIKRLWWSVLLFVLSECCITWWIGGEWQEEAISLWVYIVRAEHFKTWRNGSTRRLYNPNALKRSCMTEKEWTYISRATSPLLFLQRVFLFSCFFFCFALDRLEIANCCLVVPSVSLKHSQSSIIFFGNPRSELRFFVFSKLLSSYTGLRTEEQHPSRKPERIRTLLG